MLFPDERLKLLFICAHPAIDAGARTPLMLQTVVGLDAVRIASAFLVRPSAMGQRLSRAKAKIRDAGIRFELPDAQELAPRLDAVLEAIYAAYGSGWEDVAGADARAKVWLWKQLISAGSCCDSCLLNRKSKDYSRSCCIAKHAGMQGAAPQVPTYRFWSRM